VEEGKEDIGYTYTVERVTFLATTFLGSDEVPNRLKRVLVLGPVFRVNWWGEKHFW